jgi:uncharacterized protein YijF (DUF1287 family)
MASHRSGFYSTIEYIGPRPQKPKRPNFFGGWVIVVISIGIAGWFGKPLVESLKAAQEVVSTEQTSLLIDSLGESGLEGHSLAAAALAHSREPVTFDPTYYKIHYPGGDIAPGKGNAADVIIRCFRRIGIDLQKEVHEDMVKRFRDYPQIFDAIEPDTNIDHRRVENLRCFFEHKGQSLKTSRDPADYQPGDVVIWSLANSEFHIGIVVPGPANNAAEPWVVHHMGKNVKWENVLFDFKVEAHFRYPATTTTAADTP